MDPHHLHSFAFLGNRAPKRNNPPISSKQCSDALAFAVEYPSVLEEDKLDGH